MTAILCDFCDDMACTTCDDAAVHLTGPSHCADSDCVAKCVDCQRGYVVELSEVTC
jgi:hypothetical protein